MSEPDKQKAMWESLRYNQDERLSLTFENRDLREELFVAQNERDWALSQIVQAECRAARFCQERDEARERYDNLATEHMLAVNKICNERDEARQLADRLTALELQSTSELARLECERNWARAELEKRGLSWKNE